MPRKVDWDERRAELAEAVWRAMVRYGVEHTSIRNIAEESGWTRGVLQLYFRDKDDLLLFAFELAADRSLEADLLTRGDAAGLEVLRRLLMARVHPSEEQVRIALVMSSFIVLGRSRPGLGEAVHRRWSDWLSFTQQLFRDLAGQVAFRPGLRPDEAGVGFIGIVQGLAQLQLIDPARFEGAAAERFVDEYLRSIGAPAELERIGLEPPETTLIAP